MHHSISAEKLNHVKRYLGNRVKNLEVISREGRIVLVGNAYTYYSKQLAQHMVLKLIHPATLENEIQVVPQATLTSQPERAAQ
jgi:hypothetical protein